MTLLTPDQIERIHRITDRFLLDRDAVIVPLTASDAGREIVLPDGKLLIRAPGGGAFESWIAGLERRLDDLDLSRTPRADVPKR